MDPDTDLQNGRIARLELEVHHITNRMKYLSLAVITTATALTILSAAIAIVVTSVK